MSTISADTILACRNLTKRFYSAHHELTVLRNINFELGRGEACAVVGPSGSGKTTLMALLAGLDRPTEGEIYIDGRNLTAMSEDELAVVRSETIGFIFQSFHLIPTLTALENVMLPRELQKGRSSREIRDAAADLLAKLGLSDRREHYPSQLSGGEQQRVAIARAFIGSPKLLFADEPTGNLDADNAVRAIDLIDLLREEHGTAVLFVTHDRELAARLPRTIRLKAGEIQ